MFTKVIEVKGSLWVCHVFDISPTDREYRCFKLNGEILEGFVAGVPIEVDGKPTRQEYENQCRRIINGETEAVSYTMIPSEE